MPRGYVSSYDRDAPRPEVGSKWLWRGVQRVTVDEVKWNGEEWWVKVSGHWNELGVFWEACKPVPKDWKPKPLLPITWPHPEHRCDERCVCPIHGTPLIYWRRGQDHACQDVDCVHGHGMRS